MNSSNDCVYVVFINVFISLALTYFRGPWTIIYMIWPDFCIVVSRLERAGYRVVLKCLLRTNYDFFHSCVLGGLSSYTKVHQSTLVQHLPADNLVSQGF